jgi:tyrosine-protein kinase Etk/Wzc
MSNEVLSTNSRVDAGGTPVDDAEYRTIDLLRYVQALWLRRFFVFGIALAGLLLGVAASFVLQPKFDAVARLQPPSPREPSLMMGFFPTRNEGDLYLGLLTGRTVADDVIDHQHLRDYFHTTHPSELRRRLAQMSMIKADKDQFITVTVRATEPETAMRIANEYVDALYRLDHSIAIAAAEHRWEYFEGPLEQEKNKLAAAEEDLKRSQQTTGIVLPDAQVRVGVNALAQLKQEIASREVQLAALRMGGTEENPRVVQLKSEIGSLNGQVTRMQAETGGGAAAGASRANLPEQALEVQRKAREVKFHETLFEILSRQYENAKVDQSYTPPIEVVDRAVLPDEKSWPPRKIIVILGFVGGGLLGLVLVILRAADVPRTWRHVFSIVVRSRASDVPHF